ncbi:DNA repair protein RecN [Elysia marginata]|uniref:DNA repair protein RecN n=1 Tax=Elysia marginata TaxID=1093978 RepID=A0AAV4F1Q6_9GAST|nr:DNA repair protein RecN [Elysia marginata]
MLKSLRIKNYALIDELEVSFKETLTTITGETGAGKSILMGAFSLALGRRADLNRIKKKGDKCIVEADFDIGRYQLESLFEESGLDYFNDTIIRREILPSGKSRAFVNDTPVTLNILNTMGSRLIDLHSQFENQKVTNPDFQVQILDTIASNNELLRVYKKIYKDYVCLQKELISLKDFQANADREHEYNKFLFNELDSIKICEGLQEELESEYEKLSNIEHIETCLSEASKNLDNEDFGAINILRNLRGAIEKLVDYGKTFEDIKTRLDSILIDLDDISGEIHNLFGDLEASPERLRNIDNQLQKIYGLQRKHRTQSVEKLLSIKKQLKERIEKTDNIFSDISKCEKALKIREEELTRLSEEIHKSRVKQVPIVQSKIEILLRNLGMLNVRFKIYIEKQDAFLPNGIDNVAFLFSANKGSDFGPVGKIASGGEKSRIMFALKTIFSEYTHLPTIIFDEIDSGISGEVAKKMATLMVQMAKKIQVIVITHLPQIAVKGQEQFKVFKQVIDNDTDTKIKLLDTQERIHEIAEMLDGKDISQSAIRHAEELLQQS